MKSTQKSTKHLSLNTTTKCFNSQLIEVFKTMVFTVVFYNRKSRQGATVGMDDYSDSGKSFKMRLVIWRGDSFLPLAIQDWQRPKKA